MGALALEEPWHLWSGTMMFGLRPPLEKRHIGICDGVRRIGDGVWEAQMRCYGSQREGRSDMMRGNCLAFPFPSVVVLDIVPARLRGGNREAGVGECC